MGFFFHVFAKKGKKNTDLKFETRWTLSFCLFARRLKQRKKILMFLLLMMLRLLDLFIFCLLVYFYFVPATHAPELDCHSTKRTIVSLEDFQWENSCPFVSSWSSTRNSEQQQVWKVLGSTFIKKKNRERQRPWKCPTLLKSERVLYRVGIQPILVVSVYLDWSHNTLLLSVSHNTPQKNTVVRSCDLSEW